MNPIDFNRSYISIGTTPIGGQAATAGKTVQTSNGQSFQELLSQQLQKQEGVTFSKHAQQRVSQRQIPLSPQLLDDLDSAVEKAQQKGVKEALVLSSSAAFIVDVSSRTVVTTMGLDEMQGNVFTNIDGAVMI